MAAAQPRERASSGASEQALLFKPGCRVRVLRGRNFQNFSEREEGELLDLDEECRNCQVVFDGRKEPVQVALKHLRVVIANPSEADGFAFRPRRVTATSREPQGSIAARAAKRAVSATATSSTVPSNSSSWALRRRMEAMEDRVEQLARSRDELLSSTAAYERMVERSERVAERHGRAADELEALVVQRRMQLDLARDELMSSSLASEKATMATLQERRTNSELRSEVEELQRTCTEASKAGEELRDREEDLRSELGGRSAEAGQLRAELRAAEDRHAGESIALYESRQAAQELHFSELRMLQDARREVQAEQAAGEEQRTVSDKERQKLELVLQASQLEVSKLCEVQEEDRVAGEELRLMVDEATREMKRLALAGNPLEACRQSAESKASRITAVAAAAWQAERARFKAEAAAWSQEVARNRHLSAELEAAEAACKEEVGASLEEASLNVRLSAELASNRNLSAELEAAEAACKEEFGASLEEASLNVRLSAELDAARAAKQRSMASSSEEAALNRRLWAELEIAEDVSRRHVAASSEEASLNRHLSTKLESAQAANRESRVACSDEATLNQRLRAELEAAESVSGQQASASSEEASLNRSLRAELEATSLQRASADSEEASVNRRLNSHLQIVEGEAQLQARAADEEASARRRLSVELGAAEAVAQRHAIAAAEEAALSRQLSDQLEAAEQALAAAAATAAVAPVRQAEAPGISAAAIAAASAAPAPAVDAAEVAALYKAAAGNDTARLGEALQSAGAEAALHARDAAGRSLLHVSLVSGADAAVQVLLQAARNSAARRRHLHNLQGELLQRDILQLVNAPDHAGRSPLAVLASCEDPSEEVAEALLEAQADPLRRDHDGVTPFVEGCRSGNVLLTQMLLGMARVAVLHDFDDASRSALHWAALQGRREVVVLLLSARAEADTTDVDGHTPLQLAQSAGHTEAVALLTRACGDGSGGAAAASCGGATGDSEGDAAGSEATDFTIPPDGFAVSARDEELSVPQAPDSGAANDDDNDIAGSARSTGDGSPSTGLLPPPQQVGGAASADRGSDLGSEPSDKEEQKKLVQEEGLDLDTPGRRTPFDDASASAADDDPLPPSARLAPPSVPRSPGAAAVPSLPLPLGREEAHAAGLPLPPTSTRRSQGSRPLSDGGLSPGSAPGPLSAYGDSASEAAPQVSLRLVPPAAAGGDATAAEAS